MSEESITKYSSYTPAQKRASQLYRQKNKDKINEQRKKYYLTRKESDPKFLEYKRLKAKEYYEKKKLDKVVKPIVDVDVEMKDVIIEEVKPDVIMTEVSPEPPIVEFNKMVIDDPLEPSVQLSKPLKGKRTTTRKKIKTLIDFVDTEVKSETMTD